MNNENALTEFLIPLDITRSSSEAVALMRCIASLLDGRIGKVTLLHATGGQYLSEHMANIDTRAARVITTDLFNRLRQNHVDNEIMPVLETVKKELEQGDITAPIDILIKDGDPVSCIVDTANEGGYSSLILQRNADAGTGLGHVAAGVLHRSVTSTIYLTGTRPISCPPARCLVALDNSDNSWKALERAAILAGAFSERLDKIVLVNVLDVTAYSQQLADGNEELDIDPAIFERASEMLTARGVDAAKIVQRQLVGDPADVLVDEIKFHDIEAVFMGRRDRGAIKELFMGSVSSRLISHCREQTIVMFG